MSTTPTEDTAVSHAETPVDPIPAEGAPHAYVAVERKFSVNADRPEWDFKAVVIPEWNTKELEYWLIQDGHTLIPIGPDGDTGTRAITEPREISDPAELNALPVGSFVLHPTGVGFGKLRARIGGVIAWYPPGSKVIHAAADLLDDGPVTLLHTGTEETETNG